MHVVSLLSSLVLLVSPIAMANSNGDANVAGQEPRFHNSARHSAADPHVIFDAKSGLYYAYSTEGADEGYNFAIYSSPDLSTWHRHPGGVLKACRDKDGNPIEGGQACWARDWYWAPETYYNEKTGWYFFFFAGRLREDLAKDHFRYSDFEEPSKLGVAVSRSPTGPFKEIESKPIDYYPFDPDYYDVNLIMDEKQMLPPQSQEEGHTAPKGTYIPHIDVNIFFDQDDRIYLYVSRNAYRNWNWDKKLGKYIEESNIIMVEMDRGWWDDPTASTMPEIIASQKDIHAKNAPELPCNIASYNGTGQLGSPPRKDGWKTVISYGADPQEWENYHVDDYNKFNGQKKDRRWSEGSTLIKRTGKDGKPVYMLTYSANNFEASNYGVGFATAQSPFGPFKKSANNPVLVQKPEGEFPINSVGHGSIVASPPRRDHEGVGAQDVTLQTPDGAELFYIHHGRNDTERSRSMYATRMEIHGSAVYFGSDDAITMSLTPLDQLLPTNTYPLKLEVECIKADGEHKYTVRVLSKIGAAFDLSEGSNRVIGRPGDVRSGSLAQSTKDQGFYEADFGGAQLTEIVYQRLNVDGTWTDIASQKVRCT